VLSGGRVNARRTLDLLSFPTKAAAGGSYTITEGQGVTLTRTNSVDPNGDAIRYSWDVNGDGTFGDEAQGTLNSTGESLSYTWAQLRSLGIADGSASYAVRVRSDDGKGHVTTSDPATLTVNDAAPTLSLSGADTVTAGKPYVLTLGTVADPGTDVVSHYVIRWRDGTSSTYTAAEVDAAGRKLTHTYAASGGTGARTITVDVRDEEGDHAAVASKALNVTTAVATRNLAVNRPATQSSTGWSGDAFRAVDGNTDGNYYAASVTHTMDDVNAWWQVDLGTIESLGTVEVFNRTDFAPDRLSDFYVLVSDTPFASTDLSATLAQSGVGAFRVTGVGGSPTQVAVNRTGRFVRIQLAGTNYLSLAEVRVFGPGGSGGTTASAAAAPAGLFSTRPIGAGTDDDAEEAFRA
jgi:hypothetical protein